MKNLRISSLFSIGFLSITGLLCSGASAQDTTLQPQIKSIVEGLLVKYWPTSKSNRTESEHVFEDASTNRKVLQAYTLNRMQHNRNTQAQSAARELTRQFPDDIDGWVLLVWLDAVTDNFDRALIGMTSLKQALSNANTVIDADYERMVLQRLGRLIGYMQGPANSAINPDTLQHAIEKVTNGLSAAQLKTFNQEREKVLTTYESRLQERGTKEKEETEKAVAAAQAEAQQLKDQNQQIDLEQSRILPRIDALRQESAQQVTNLGSQLSPLQATGSSIASQLNAVRSDLQILGYDILLVQNALYNDPHNYYLTQQLAYLVNQARIREFDMARMNNDLASIDAQISNINAQIAQTQNLYDGQIAVLAEEIKLGERTKRRNLKKLAQLSQGPKVISAKLNSIDVRTDALTTYDPFPVELYRDRFLKQIN